MTATAPTSPFSHAVASFEPTSSAVLLWTRVDEGVATSTGPSPPIRR